MNATNQQAQAAPPAQAQEKKKNVFFFKCAVTFDKFCLRIANNRPLPGYRAVVIKVTESMRGSSTAYHQLPWRYSSVG